MRSTGPGSTTWSKPTSQTDRSSSSTPFVAVVTNIEADHLDHYGTLEFVEAAFVEFMGRVAADGALVVSGDSPRVIELAEKAGRRVITYGFAETCDVRCRVLGREGIGTRFEVTLPDGVVVNSLTKVPGDHMALNGTASLATAWFLGLDVEAAARALVRLLRCAASVRPCRRGRWRDGRRRLRAPSHRGARDARRGPGAGLHDGSSCCSSHTATRGPRCSPTDFGDAFADADRITFMDVYSAGEPPIPGVSGKTLLEKLLDQHPRAQAAYLPHRGDIVTFLASRCRPGDLVLTMGAGDVTTVGPELVRELAAVEASGGDRCR